MIVNGIDTKDISVVVQGAVTDDTKKCLKSIRNTLPNSPIILSTWKDCKLDELDYDVLVQSEDPGAFPCDAIDNSVMNNVNRQIVSSKEGVARCKTKYCIKMRTDFVLNDNGFLSFFGIFKRYDNAYKFVNERIVACNLYSRNTRFPIKDLVMPYCPSDFFFFGLTEDIYALFNRDVITSIDEKMYFELHPEKKKLLNSPNSLCQFMPEQTIWMGFISKFINELDCSCRDEITENNTITTEKTFANNLVLCSPKQLGIDSLSPTLFSKGIPENCLTHEDWLDLYGYYCEKNQSSLEHFIKRTQKHANGGFSTPQDNKDKKEKKQEYVREYRVESLEEISHIVTEYEYVSFDVFDTLVFRFTAPDWQAMAQTSEYICMLLNSSGMNVTVSEIDHLRNVYANIDMNNNPNKSREYKFRSVIRKVLFSLGVENNLLDSYCNMICENEIKREINGIYANKEALPIVERLYMQGKKLIAISDMYVSKEDIELILSKTGFRKFFSYIFVSSDVGLTKLDGRLYKYVLSHCNISSNELIHIGDNQISDVSQAQKNGISSIYYCNSDNITRKNKISSEVLDNNNSKNYLIDALGLDFNPRSFAEYIQYYLSFDIINFVYDLSRKLYKNGTECVFFLERDGTFYGKIYTKLVSSLKIFEELPSIKLADIKISRKDSACLVNIYSTEEVINRAYCVNPPSRFHIIHILGCFGLSLDCFDESTAQEIVNHNSDRGYFDKIYFEKIFPLINENRQRVIDMLSKKHFFDFEKIAIVDIGWGGTTQKDINSYITNHYRGHECFGYYYACDERAVELAPYYSQYHFGPSLFYAYSLLEFLIKNYSSSMDDIQQQCNTSPELRDTLMLNFQCREQILKDVKIFIDAVNKYHLTPEIIRQFTYPRLLSLINEPPIPFLNMLRDTRFSLDRKFNDNYLPLFEELTKREELIKEYECAQWVQATLRISKFVPDKGHSVLYTKYHNLIDNGKTPRIIVRFLKWSAKIYKAIFKK